MTDATTIVPPLGGPALPAPDICEATLILPSSQWSRLPGYATAHDVEVGELLFRPGDAGGDLILTGAMLTVRRQRFHLFHSVAGSIGVITSVVAGSDVGVLAYGLGAPLAAAFCAGTITALLGVWASVRFQRARWKGATATEPPS